MKKIYLLIVASSIFQLLCFNPSYARPIIVDAHATSTNFYGHIIQCQCLWYGECVSGIYTSGGYDQTHGMGANWTTPQGWNSLTGYNNDVDNVLSVQQNLGLQSCLGVQPPGKRKTMQPFGDCISNQQGYGVALGAGADVWIGWCKPNQTILIDDR